MPLDKSRIQGIGSDGTVTSATSSSMARPQGHEDESSVWGAISSMADRVGGPGLTSALDSISLQVGDILQATSDEINEMGAEIQEFVNSAIGLGDSDEEVESSAPMNQRSAETCTVAQRQEAASAICSFCEHYPAYRVAPKPDEIEALLKKCEYMNSQAVISAMYDQLSFSSGELEWQPRLRCLHVLEYCHSKDGGWRKVSSIVAQQGEGLIKHWTDVQQCRQKAIKVYILLLGKAAAQAAGLPVPTKAEEEAAAVELAKAKIASEPAAAKRKASSDLLDFASASPEPKANALAKAHADAAESLVGPADLLDSFEEESAPPVPNLVPDLDLLNPAPFLPAASASAPEACRANPFPGAGVLTDVSLPTASDTVAPGKLCANVSTAALLGSASTPSDLFAAAFNSGAGASSSSTGVVSGGAAAVSQLDSASTGFAAFSQASPYPSMGPPAPAPACLAKFRCGGGGTPTPAQPTPSPMLPRPPVSSGSLGRPRGGGYNIPKASELTPLSSEKAKDPFDFVMQHTGIGDAK